MTIGDLQVNNNNTIISTGDTKTINNNNDNNKVEIKIGILLYNNTEQ
jgi:hypothetical protein